MVRSFIVLLLLALFFLTGMLYGMDRENIASIDDSVEQIESVDVEAIESEQTEKLEKIEVVDGPDGRKAEGQPIHLTEKTASLLEAGVKGFYDVVVQILYQISQLFF